MRVGLFGKLPAHGDFISRNLPAPLRKSLDQWVTHNIGQEALPENGLRQNLTLGDVPITAIILPSQDKSGRIFPIVAVVAQQAQVTDDIEAWCDHVAAHLQNAVRNAVDADTLLKALPEPAKAT